MFRWNDSYSVHIAAIDREHQGLFEILKELDEALAAGKGQNVIGGILRRVLAYTDQHFSHEEALMKAHEFPGLELHRAEHVAARSKVLNFERDYRQGKTSIPVSLLLFLDDWLKNHILKSDKSYSAFLNDKGVR